MFNFLKRTKNNIKSDNINNFNKVLKTIEVFIDIQNFEKAEKAIDEVIYKENESFKDYIEKVAEKNKKQELKNFKHNLDKLDKLKKINNLKKGKYEQKQKIKKINEEKNELANKEKLAIIHSWMRKEIYWEKINWYDIYRKTISADRISGDALWFYKSNTDYKFFIWDTTGHGIKAWFIINQLIKKINKIALKFDIWQLVINVNNSLKQDLKSWNFITSIFFKIDKKNFSKISIIWMWHEPLFIYRKTTGSVEKIITWWLAAWIRLIKDSKSLKIKYITLEDGDIIMSYTDWIVEAKNEFWEMYWIDRIWKKLEEFCENDNVSLQDLQSMFINDLKKFTWWRINYNDDITILLLRKDKNKNKIFNNDIINDLIKKEWLEEKYNKKFFWKTNDEIKEEILNIKKEKKLKDIIKSLEKLYKNWELSQLKEDCVKYINEWYEHTKINYFLKKAVNNKNIFKRIKEKYIYLKELYKIEDNETFIVEILNFFRKKENTIKLEDILNFNKVLKTIEDFIKLEDFIKAGKAIDEVIYKETESFNDYIENVSEKNKKQELKKFKHNLDKLNKLKEINNLKKAKYEQKQKIKEINEEKFFIDKQIKNSISSWNFIEPINILNLFLEKNSKDLGVISFVNKRKKEINIQIEKDKLKKKRKIKNDTFLQAQELIWEIIKNQEKIKNIWNITFIEKIKSIIWFYSNIRKKIRDKRLLEEVELLLQLHWEKNETIAKAKLAKIHSWIIKEIYSERINWYDIYGKIIWADRISGDALWFLKSNKDYKFFIWDATWHGIKAWFTITQLTKKFHEIASKLDILKIVININNSLKQDLKSWNFITSIFFKIDKDDFSKISIIWMWHEPIFIYRKSTGIVEKLIAWWLAAWIRLIKDEHSVKVKNITLEDGDILMSYTDWIVEAKNESWEMYSIERIWKKLAEFGKNTKSTLQDLQKMFIDDLKNFAWWRINYNDDITILLLKRDKNKEILLDNNVIDKLIEKEWLDKKYKKKFFWKTPEEIKDEILKIQKENAIKNIIRSLETLYKIWEIPKLKQDCIRYIKEWYIHQKINFFLKKALDNENSFKINQKNKKIQDKYTVLKELYKKQDYETVITECSNIISKDWTL